MAAQSVGFVHLRVRSAFSLLEGALKLGALIKLAAQDGQPALAVTDTNNLFGALEFSEKAAEAGLQPIIGMTLSVDFGALSGNGVHGQRQPHHRTVMPHLVLLAKDDAGYRNLMRLSSRAFLETAESERPHIPVGALGAHAEGLICLTGGPGGPVDLALLARKEGEAEARLQRLAALFGERLYVELQRHGVADEAVTEPELVRLAYAHGLPLVATNDAHFAGREDFEAHDALLAIAEGRVVADQDRRRLTPEHFFKPRGEMIALFQDLPEATASTVEISRRCAYRPLKRKPILPSFAAAGMDAEAAEAAELRAQSEAGLALRLREYGLAPGQTEEDYHRRLAYELDIIEKTRFPGYFLIVSDFIKWAKAQAIPVGPGRGSGVGSLVAYSVQITDLDPLRFNLLFERLLSLERVSMPDFDVDFCQDRRGEVIRYVQEKYGRENVAQIITFGTLQPRAVLRDVGRVLQMPYGQVDRLAKLIPFVPTNPVSLAQAIEGEPKLQAERDKDPVVRRLLGIGLKLEGLYRHASTHAAGVVIGDRPLIDLVPLFRDPRSEMPATQFNMKWVESAGLVKFDFLGLKTLTVLSTAVKLLARRGINLDLGQLPLDDVKTYEMLARGETVGVFQLESGGMRRALVEMRADRFEDIIALVSLYRPGPMANIPTYNARKHGQEQPDYLHPRLEPILKETHGVIIYQEQVMQIARELAGYSLGEADLLRRAMGKKIKAEMAVQRERFVKGAAERGVDPKQSEHIFELVARFADYGFNKSHAAAYALIAYQTAWLKANHPVEFLAASMTLDMGNTDKVHDFRREAQRYGIALKPPSINRSGTSFEVEEGALVYALCALKGVGGQAVEHIVETRKAGPFRDLSDFARRIDPRVVNKRTLESLAAAGAFDALEPNRRRVMENLDRLMAEAAHAKDEREGGQAGLFGAVAPRPIELPAVEPWTVFERLNKEYEAVGFYLSGHPLDEYAAALKAMNASNWSDFARGVREGRDAGRIAAVLVERQDKRTKTGNRIGVLTFSDPSGQFEAVAFSDTLAALDGVLQEGKALLLLVQAEEQAEGLRVRIQNAEALDGVAKKLSKGLRVFLRSPAPLESLKARLAAQGEGEIRVVVVMEGAREVELKLPGRYAVSPQLAGAIKAVPGVLQVESFV